MWHEASKNSIESLRPQTAADRHSLYAMVRDALEERFPTWVEPVRRLAIAAVRHLDGKGGRILLRGDAGTRATKLVRGFAEVLGLPYLEIDAGMLAETNWSGGDIGFYLDRLHAEIAQQYPPSSALGLTERACVLVDQLDQVRLAGGYANSSTRDYREGKQQSLAPLFGDGVIPVAPSKASGFLWHSARALVVATACFDDLPSRRPDEADLVEWGLLPPLAQALAAGIWINLDPPTAAEIGAQVSREIQHLVDRFLEFGYHLQVAPQVVGYVTRAVTVGPYTGGAASAAGWIRAAVELALIRMLEDGAQPGDAWVLAVDDLSLPGPPKGMWRE